MQPIPEVHTDGPVYSATRACFADFCSCIDALAAEHKDYLRVRFADLKLWADSVGAMAEDKASLDWRLREQPEDRFVVISLLDMMGQFLEGYKRAASSGNDQDRIREAKQGIDGTTDNLGWVGSAIRRFGTKSRLQKADKFHERDKENDDKWHYDQLRAHLVCIIKSRPSKNAVSQDFVKDYRGTELKDVQGRLVEANLRRWHRFRYAQRHADVLKTSREFRIFPVAVDMESNSPDPTQEPIIMSTPRVSTAAAKASEVVNSNNDTRTTAGLSASAFGSDYQGLRGQQTQRAKSTVSQISTTTGRATFPRMRKPQIRDFKTQQRTLMCPCCCQALPLDEFDNPSLWM
jgi:hypothetical protein